MNTDLRQAAQQALEALEAMQSYAAAERKGLRICDESITALKAALAEPVQEPVAWMVYTLDGKSVCVTDNPADFTDEHRVLPLYTTPPQRKPLTEEEIIDAVRDADLVAAAERNKLAAWMIQFGFATGHGDTMEQLVDALGCEIVKRIKFEIDTEREVCAQMADDVVAGKSWFNDLPADIRTRSNDAP